MAETILVVDDNASTVQLLEKLLSSQGYNVVKASDGLDAMVMVKKAKPDLIFLDVMMPEINGYDVCLHLKFDEEYKHIPIVLLTARDRELDTEIAKKAGIEYVKKPFQAEVITELVKWMLKKEKS